MTQNKDNGTSGTTTGAVLVVGAGIGGMQASLDLADSGFKVYLADKSPAIGGIMAQLDKTFPTNDCSMCIMSPKLVEVGRHLNVDIMTMSEVESIGGSAGDFTVTLRRKARYVDVAKCTGCGDCEGVCPISLPDQFNEGLSERRAAFKLYPQAIPNAFALEKVGTAPCRDACPIDQRAQGYIALIREGRFADAYRTIKEENPFPSICGRVCNHRCEDACNRGKVDAPLNIMGLKRFVADWAAAHPDEIQAVMPEILQEPNGKRVAIVGSGPAGLTAALDLTRMGYETTVLEAQPVPGGMMRIGVPGYRLPHDVVQREIAEIVAAGVDIKLNHRVDDMAALLHGGYHAVLIAVGAHDGIALPIPGADSPDVHVATDFLRCASLGEPLDVQGKRVLVIGGGNVAVDSAQTAVRTGASWVGMSCLESRETMPAHDWEIEDAQEEGIEVFPSRTFREIVVVGGQVTGVRCVQVDFRGFVDGRPDFDEIPDTEQVLPADIVIFAIGQRPDLSGVPDGIDMFRGRFLASDRETMATNIPGVFAAGDVVTGTSFIVDAIAAGHKAAHSIHSYLSTGEPSTWQSANPSQMVVELSPDEAQAKLVADEAISSGPRAELPKLSAAERTDSFVEVYGGFTEAEAMAEAQRCLICGVCSECNQCFYACKAEAIDHYQKDELVEVKVGAVVLAPGLKPVEGTIRPEFGYGHYANVVTSLEFERMLSASGPFAGEVKRPSDGRHPVKVAFIQCVGSRDTSCGNGYCSSVCCMYATKEAVIAKEHDAHIEPAIFYMDIRAFGKGFEQYIDRAKDEHGVRYVRSMVSSVREVPGTGNLRVQYALFDRAQSAPRVVEEEFDLVVLSVGLKPADGTFEMSQRLGLELNSYGFCEAEPFCPTLTNRPGIYVAGGFGEPKDIPETVIEASSAAAAASCLLADSRGSLTRQMVYPEERDISEEETKVGVFVCHCGINIGGVVKVPEVVEYVKTLPNVVYAEHNLYTCSQDTQEKITEVVKEKGLNRVVVASCTPRTHEPLFQDTIRQAGLNPHLFELANIREQDSWVHRELGREVATEKAKDLVRMAVAKASRLRPIQRLAFEVNHRALVVGGGLAGMMAALTVADQGFDVVLLEREGELGGNLRHIYTGFDGSDPQGLLSDTIRRIGENERISVLLNAELRQVSGYVGAFESRVRQADGTWHDLKHGAIIIATGGREIEPSEYGYGTLPGVMTQRQYEQLIRGGRSAESQEGPNSVVMIQCVGSRDEAHPYCSRICCSEAIKNALETKRRNPSAEVAILYRDIRTFGFKEDLYREARASGVLFLQYDPENKPTVQSQNGRLAVQVAAQPEGEVVTLPADVLVLSAGIEPLPENEELAQLVKVPLDQDGFFLEAHVKLRPLDFAADGVYLCGLAHSPRFIDESIAQAKGAAIRAVTLLAKEKLDATAITAEVNPRLCSACGICVDTCPYNARIIPEDDGYYAHVIDVLCQGCGACIVACPNGATQQKGFEFKQIFSVIDAALASA